MIGPLPDGYVIDVQRKTWLELMEAAGMDWPVALLHADTYADHIGDYSDPILDTYNA